MREHLGRWLRRYRSPHTRRAYRGQLLRAREALGAWPEEVDAGDLADYLATLKGASASQANAAVRSYLRLGTDAAWWDARASLALLRSPGGASEARRAALTRTEIEKLEGATFDFIDRRLLALLYLGGLRVSEAVAARAEHLEIEPPRGAILHILGKGDRQRSIRLSPRCIDALDLGAGDSPWLIPGRGEQHLSARQARRRVRQLGQRVGLDVAPHDLRHAHGTHAVRAGCPLHVLQASFGHKSLRTTATYLHASPTEGSSDYL